ncbi:hypothetical protein GCM10009863_39450 [Streptomyces axinellae]|uniref:Tn3 transposase DDE domain-containing protein n=1 Tax=Streptomyces axinellae TaxID=552788 RepID=A0ABP6CKH8_9ACTN
MLAPLLKALELKCDNTAYRPVMDAIDLLKRYLEQPLKEGAFFDPAETVPLQGVVLDQWRAAVVDDKGRVERIPYELCVLVALRDALRRREIWVVGANRWRNPEDDLPADFEDNRDVHYAAQGQPQDAGEFITALQRRLRTSLDRFEQALAEAPRVGVAIVKKHGQPWIRVSPRGKQEEPESLVAVKGEIERRWGTIDLLDILKYAEFGTDFIAESTSVATRENLSKDVLRRRLLLVLSTKTINWDLIRQQHDQIVNYTTALRLGTAEAEQVLRRFTRGGPRTPPPRRSRNSGGRCGRRSSATTWPTPSCGRRSTRDRRSWRTGTPRTRTSSTARTATWPDRTRSPRRCPCSPCTCSSPPWSTSTRC